MNWNERLKCRMLQLQRARHVRRLGRGWATQRGCAGDAARTLAPAPRQVRRQRWLLRSALAASAATIAVDASNEFQYCGAAVRFARSLKIAGQISCDYSWHLWGVDEESAEHKQVSADLRVLAYDLCRIRANISDRSGSYRCFSFDAIAAAERDTFAECAASAQRLPGQWRLVHQNRPRSVSHQSYPASGVHQHAEAAGGAVQQLYASHAEMPALSPAMSVLNPFFNLSIHRTSA